MIVCYLLNGDKFWCRFLYLVYILGFRLGCIFDFVLLEIVWVLVVIDIDCVV